MTTTPISPRTCKDCRHKIIWAGRKPRKGGANYKHADEENGHCTCGCVGARPFAP